MRKHKWIKSDKSKFGDEEKDICVSLIHKTLKHKIIDHVDIATYSHLLFIPHIEQYRSNYAGNPSQDSQ